MTSPKPALGRRPDEEGEARRAVGLLERVLRNPDTLNEEVATAINIAAGRNSGDVKVDLMDPASIRAMFAKLGRVDAIVATARDEASQNGSDRDRRRDPGGW